MKKRNIGIIGCGNIANVHVEAILDSVDDPKISVCDPLEGKAELLRKKYNLHKSYQNIEEMMGNENLESIHVLSPPQLHYIHTKLCLQAGCHVLVEKPFVFKYDEAEELFDLASKYNKVLCVDHSLLYQPSIVKMINEIKSTPGIEILHINSFYGMDVDPFSTSSLPSEHWKNKLKGGALIDTMIHPITVAAELTGKPHNIVSNVFYSKSNMEEGVISWQTGQSSISITVSNTAQPFQRTTQIYTNRKTFIIDHSTEVLTTLYSGIGPKALRKLFKNMSYSKQLSFGTLSSVFKVLRKKIKDNPGTRGLINKYYEHLDGKNDNPVSKTNVLTSVSVIERISQDLDSYQTENKKNTIAKIKNEKIQGKFKSKIFITGASGFLGNELCRILSDKDHKIIAQVRRGPNADKLTSSGIDKIYFDFTNDIGKIQEKLAGVETVIHSAHASGAKTWDQFEKINIDSTLKLYEAARKSNCKKFIFLSSVAVYGVHQKRKITVDEDSPTSMGKSKWDFYIRSKVIAEKKLIEISKQGGPKLIILRPGILYSANGYRLARKGIPINDKMLLISFGNGKNIAPFTRVDVLAKQIAKIIDMDPFPEGIYNVNGSPKINTREFIYTRMKDLGIECNFLTLPALPFRELGHLLELIFSISFRKSPPPITRYLIDSSTRNIKYDCSKAIKAFGWDPEEAIKPL